MTDFSVEEVQLATRNHGMPLEALRYDVTPVGLHYLLTHYDIPYVDPDAWRLEVGGLVSTPLSLSLDDVRARDAHEVTVTMECAGNAGGARSRGRSASRGSARRSARRAGEASGCATCSTTRAWGRAPSSSCSPRSTAASRTARSWCSSAASRWPRPGARSAARLRDQRSAAAAAARRAAPTCGARLVRHDEREVAARDHGRRRALHRLPAGARLHLPRGRTTWAVRSTGCGRAR